MDKNNSKEIVMKKQIIIDLLLLGCLIFSTVKLLGMAQTLTIGSRLINENEKIREMALEAFQRLSYTDKEKHVNFLIIVLRDKDHPARYLAAHALGNVGPLSRKAIPELVEALKSDDYDIRWNAIYTLNYMGTAAKETAPDIVPFLRSQNKYERASAAIALVSLGETQNHLNEIIPQLIAAVNYNDRGTRQRSITMLGNLGSVVKAAIPTLLHSAQSSDDKIRRYAVWALGRMGERHEDIYQNLVKAITDEDHNVRLNALISLDILYPEAKHNIPRVKQEIVYGQSKGVFDSALLFSAYEGDAVDAKALINLGANVNAKGYYTGKTPLMIAVEHGHLAMVKFFLDNRADVNQISDQTGVNMNIREPFLPMSLGSLLSDHYLKRKRDDKKYEGKTVLMYAIESEIPEEEKLQLIELIVKYGVDIKKQAKDSQTALEIAEKLQNRKIVEYLRAYRK